jgi:hypothetical protein
LFDALAAWRQAFLSYYRWLDTGDGDAWGQWRAGKAAFEIAAQQHSSRFGADLDFPGFDLTSATEAIAAADRGGWARAIAAALLLAVIGLLSVGSPLGHRWRAVAARPALAKFSKLTWNAAATPWRLDREPVHGGSAVAVTMMALTLVGLLVATLTGFTTMWVGAGSPFLIGIVAIAFESTAIGVTQRQGRGRLLVASVGPLIPGVIVLFALVAYFGPLGFWYRFWIWPVFRIVFLTTVLATLLWTAYVMLAAHTLDGWPGRVGASLAAVGAGFIALTILMPGWVDALRSLDRPLNFAPATETMLFALRTYAGVSLDAGGRFWMLGTLLFATGHALCLRPLVARMTRRPLRSSR